ncbi:fumarylacetoacetate hydrolase family protein [Paenarthrobacter sp. A20]|uniref:fumarylacetoacetate hydrolase family protein n=1 Tax=Paenarthrobacter sp. A20 TaxID=2817891 RepID=UPI0020A200EF|nr:fumarylacetoacetate hydrolase family protein [Paenarthrobacter sp. A20]MCP1415597.1 2-keto-4-pentenoate hydratase/2-oxohepta-3-ene-1,7-dioic acid hydratase in catechol pathway [Paenarthrobacter sp. A20]
MNMLIEGWQTLEPKMRDAAHSTGIPRSRVTFRAPQPRPSKILAAPVNHGPHREEMIAAGAFSDVPGTIEKYVAFLKAPSSVVGPDEAIRLPDPRRRVDHEAELGVVIGTRAKNTSRGDALSHVFGYLALIDVTMRGDEDRSYRKSFDTFTPLGPAIVTADEIPDPSILNLRLSVNGDLRQDGQVADLIYDVAQLIEVYSEAMTLNPGDIIASGTPNGVGPLTPGDTVTLAVSQLPPLTIAVRASKATIPATADLAAL